MRRVILPPATIGIIGGGQLGKMIAIEAKHMGYRVIVLDPDKTCPCAQVCDEHIVGDLNSYETLEHLCHRSDLVTYEFENVDVAHIESLEKEYFIPQGSKCLKISQDRWQEKEFARTLGIPVAACRMVNTWNDLIHATLELDFPIILKTNRLGYDGKGQIKLINEETMRSKKEEILSLLRSSCIAETLVSFDLEISVIYTRGYENSTVFPIPRNIHEQGILKDSLVPSHIEDKLKDEAIALTATLAEAMDYVGTMAVEFFIKDGELYFNEMAPRVHNTGHFSLDVCSKSQFRTHVEAICGYLLSPILLYSEALMRNILGKNLRAALRYRESNTCQQANLYLYGKTRVEPNRKIGHITFFGDTLANLMKNVQEVEGNTNDE